MKSLKRFIYPAFIAIFLIGAFSCNKEELKPVLSFASKPGYQANDTVLAVGDTIKVLLDITWNGKHRITEVVLNVNDQLAGKYPLDVDEGQFSFTIVKGLPDVEVWDFTVSDEGGNVQTIRLTLTKDPNSLYGGLKYYDSIYLGAQGNPDRPGFLSLTNSTYYRLEGAYLNQSMVEVIFYFDEAHPIWPERLYFIISISLHSAQTLLISPDKQEVHLPCFRFSFNNPAGR